MGCIIISLIARSKVMIRDFIYGPLAGMIFAGASSYFTANLAYCLGAGLVGGAIQGAIHNTF